MWERIGWMLRLNMTKFKINIQGQEKDVEVTRQGDQLHVEADGISAELRLIDQEGATFVVQLPMPDGSSKQIRAAGHVDGDRRQLWVNGRSFNYERIRQRSSGTVLDGSLSSTIPAVVSQILVSQDELVQAGDKLILLESMKMIIPIIAPCDSKVIAVHCTEGESIQSGVPLIELEE